MKQSSKRRSSTSPGTTPPHKSPRTDVHSPTTESAFADGKHSEMDKPEVEKENSGGSSCPPVSPTARRKSWRRATLTRRSLPAITNPYQGEMTWQCYTLSLGVVFPNIITCWCVCCSIVQEHKCIFITSRKAWEIDGGFYEGECVMVISIVVIIIHSHSELHLHWLFVMGLFLLHCCTSE